MNPHSDTIHIPTHAVAAAIRVICLGRAGCRIGEWTARQGLSGAEFFAADTSQRSLMEAGPLSRITLGAKLSRGLGAGGDVDLGRAASESDIMLLREIVKSAKLVVICAGLGRGTGGGAAPVVARLARESGAIVLAVVTLPFECEQSARAAKAQGSLEAIAQEAHAVLTFDNEASARLLGEGTLLTSGFDAANRMIADSIAGLIRAVTRPGLMELDLADLANLMEGGLLQGSFVTLESTEQDRVGDLMSRLEASPMLQFGEALSEGEALLACVAGGPEMEMAELSRLTAALQARCASARIQLAASVDPAQTGKLSLTLVAARRVAPSEPSRVAVHDAANPILQATPDRTELKERLLPKTTTKRRTVSKYVPPAPELTQAEKESMYRRQRRGRGGLANLASRLQQGVLPLELVSRGRFENCEPTFYKGEDLDVPTFMRKGVTLN